MNHSTGLKLMLFIILLLGSPGQATEIKISTPNIFDIISNQNYSKIKKIPKAELLTAVNDQGLRAIHLAAMNNPDPEVIRLLVDYGEDLDCVAGGQQNCQNPAAITGTPLYFALCYNPELRVIDYILELQAATHDYKLSELTVYAMRNPNLKIVDDFNLRMTDEFFLFAAANPNTAVMDRYRTIGANINGIYHNGRTSPLNIAVQTNNLNGVKYLLDNGAYLAWKNAGGRTALLNAAGNDMNHNTSKIVKLLLDRGSYVNDSDLDGNTALHLAVKQATAFYQPKYYACPLDVIQEILRYHPNVFQQNAAGFTPLEYARAHLQTTEGRNNLASAVIKLLEQAQAVESERLLIMQACG